MVPTLRLVVLTALGAPLWLLWLAVPTGWVAGIGYLVVLAALLRRDYGSLPVEGDFEVERHFGRLSIGTTGEVRLVLTNRSDQTLQVTVREELPPALEQTTPRSTLEIRPDSSGECSYKIRPHRRGRFELTDLVVRVGRPRARIHKQLRLPAPAILRVYPRFATADEYRLLARINQRDEAARRTRQVRGRGTEFESLSKYNRGDDPRTVDWKASAKRGYLVSRNLQTERGQQISMMIDGGRLMAQRIGDYSRFEHALNAAVMLSHVAQKRGDTVAVATFSDRIESFTPATRGTAIVRTVMDSLSTVQVRQVESDYWHVVGQVMAKLKRRSLLIMMTDILDANASSGLIDNMARAAARHLVLCVVLTEARVEHRARSMPETVSDTFLKAAASHLWLQRHLALEQMRNRGILVLETPPEDLTVGLIRRYLEIRKADLQ